MQDVEKQRLEDLGCVTPAGEVEGLETSEAERVVYVVEEESVLAVVGPAVQPFLQLADDLGERGERPLVGETTYIRSIAS